MRVFLGCLSAIVLLLALAWFIGGISMIAHGDSGVGAGVTVIVMSVVPFLIFFGIRKLMKRLP